MSIPHPFARFLMILVLSAPAAATAAEDLTTEFERSAGRRTASYEQTMDYIARLDRASDQVKATTFGVSPEGRPLPLVIVERRGRFRPEQSRGDGRVVVLIQAGIHAGEIDGKDAGFLLLREIAVERSLAGLLDHATILFIPIFNVDGHERVSPYNRSNQNGPENAGFRVTANNLNLNRDYVKADAPEMRDWLALFNAWEPDLLIDCHVSDGADFQHVVTYVAERWQSSDPELAAWAAETFAPALEARMAESGFPLAPYCDFRRAHDPLSGMSCGPYPPRFSTGYAALRNRAALLIETHMFKDYATRVRGTREMLRHALAIANEEHARLRAITAAADARTAAAPFRGQPFPVKFETNYDDSVMIDFLGYEYRVEKSEITGGDWYRYSDTPRTLRIPCFADARVETAVALPEAYVVPAPWRDAIVLLRAHGVRAAVLREPASIAVRSTRFHDVSWKDEPFEGRHALSYTMEEFDETRVFPPGSLVIDMAQPRARVIAHLLEPAAGDALVRTGFMDAIFEQKEYIESYVLEGVIRRMLADDPSLAGEFEAAKADTAFARDPERIRQWFYRRTPYHDSRQGVYPVGRIVDRSLLDALPLAPDSGGR